MKQPFVSFIVMAYNCEKYIEEAIDGALSQTYNNMEILISDDCSTDNTFARINDKIRKYKGDKVIRILRNEFNLGIGAHLNKLWLEEANGSWIIPSAGDDISLPHRTERMMEEADDKIALIHADFIQINESSNIVEKVDKDHERRHILVSRDLEQIILKSIHVTGCCMAINKEMMKYFGPFLNGVVNEDVVLSYRAVSFGQLVYVDETLVKYRIHRKSVSFTTANYVNFTSWKIKKQDLRFKAGCDFILMKQIICDMPKLIIDDEILSRKFLKIRINGFIFGFQNFSTDFFFSIYFYAQLVKMFFYPVKYQLGFILIRTRK